MRRRIVITWVLLWGLAGVLAQAGEVVVEYVSGVDASAGVAGAADPVAQGWTFTGDGSGYADGYDSGDGGWRTVDGTGGAPANYGRTLTAPQVALLQQAASWRLTWTLAMDKDALTEDGGSVTDYYLSPNHGRQNNLIVLIDVADKGYYLSHRLDASNQLYLRDELTTTEYHTGVLVGPGWPGFVTFVLTYDAEKGAAVVDYGGGRATIAEGDPVNTSKAYFGAGNSAGQGSAVWNEWKLETHELGTVLFIR